MSAIGSVNANIDYKVRRCLFKWDDCGMGEGQTEWRQENDLSMKREPKKIRY
jgi:hypothetical protein